MNNYNNLFLAGGILLLSSIFLIIQASGQNYFNNLGNNESEELIDKMTYMCMQMENLDGLDKIVDEGKKQQCIDLLDNADYSDRQKLLQTYGEFDN